MNEKPKCKECGDPPHRPGQCERCGCGESEVIQPTRRPRDEDYADGYRIYGG